MIPGTVCSADVVKAHRKALNDLYRAQKADTALADLMENVPPPREAQLKDAMASLTRLKAQNRRKMFVDPGLNHPNRSQLTCAQLEQALQYGLLDGPGPPRRTAIIAPEVHLTVVAGMACMQRSDTVLNALMTNYFLMEAPTTEARGRQACVLLGVCSDDVRCWLRRVRLAPVLVVLSRPPPSLSRLLCCAMLAAVVLNQGQNHRRHIRNVLGTARQGCLALPALRLRVPVLLAPVHSPGAEVG